jgi:nucleotide-binding universal stress UspA family protein
MDAGGGALGQDLRPWRAATWIGEAARVERGRFVVGVDGSAAAREALRWAVTLAGLFTAEIVAVHAVGLLEDAHDPSDEPDAWRAGVRDRVEHSWCAGLAGSPGGHRIVVCDGPPDDVLRAVARDEHADLLIVGSRGVGAANPDATLGSTSLRLLQATRLPVLVVPEPRHGAPYAGRLSVDHIVVGVDRSPASLAALELGAEVARATGGSLSAVEAFEYVPPFPLERSSVSGTTPRDERGLEAAYAALDAEVGQLRDRGVCVQVVVRSGEPAPTVLQVAADVDADVVVVGTRGRGDPAQPLPGSVARAVVHSAGRPVLVVPATTERLRPAPRH